MVNLKLNQITIQPTTTYNYLYATLNNGLRKEKYFNLCHKCELENDDNRQAIEINKTK